MTDVSFQRAGRSIEQDLPPSPSVRPQMLAGLLFGVGGFLGVLIWLFTAGISGAVVSAGLVVVEGEVKLVQHQTGGIVAALHVHNGDRVEAGALLVTLDSTIAQSSLAQIDSQLVQLTARRARLEAERDGRGEAEFPASYPMNEPEAAATATRERLFLKESRISRAQQAEQLGERLGQFEREVEGLSAQVEAKSREISLIAVELRGIEELLQRNLIPIGRATALQRETARLGGEKGALLASIAKAKGQMAEIRIQLLSIDQRARADAVKELGDVEASISQLSERRVTALDTLRRIEIRAPQSGYVHQLAVHTIGGVIPPGATILQIVPDQDRLAVEFRVSPTDIDQIHLGQRVTLRFSAFNQRTTPDVAARLTRISADAVRDGQTGTVYFVGRATAEPEAMVRLGALTVGPGMPAEVFVQTGERSAASYFLKPLSDALRRTMREE
ncbi:MAG TPA: HlyD family type I secretion periplasmic adaptor subunit [Rhabdaerophilum sp.]|nr:HlyD family type I secretion periplasmic adaptor subunit [Rhabdaerophilum sp.]